MMAAIPDAIRPRLGQFVRLLASDQPGEIVAAADAIRRALAGVGADFHDLAGVVECPASLTVPTRRLRKPKGDRGHINWTSAHRARVSTILEKGLIRFPFNAWERDFITSIIGRLRSPTGRLTFKQAEVAERLVAKVESGH